MASSGDPGSQIERAWHLLTVLIRFGRPAYPAELAAICGLVAPPPSSDLVERLCRIPGSPLMITEVGLVTVSETATRVLGEFVSNSGGCFVPRARIRVLGRREQSDVSFVYCRKRRVREVQVGLPVAKRRLFLPTSEDVGDDGMNQLSLVKRTSNSTEVCLKVADYLTRDDLAADAAALSIKSDMTALSSEAGMLPALWSNPNLILSSHMSEKAGHVIECDAVHQLCEDKNSIIMNKEFMMLLSTGQHFFADAERISDTNEKIVGHIPKASEHDVGRTLADTCIDNPEVAPLSYLMAGPTENVADNHVVHFENEEEAPNGTSLAKLVCYNGMRSSFATDTIDSKFASAASQSVEPAAFWKKQKEHVEVPNIMSGVAIVADSRSSDGASPSKSAKNVPKLEQVKRGNKHTLNKHKSRRTGNRNLPFKESKLNTTKEINGDEVPRATKTLEPKSLPNFESFVVEEEEGSGGYGTVYRAQRKKDGKIFAIKCPHANAHLHHVHNEMKMLERFGGRNFVIKFEGSFKSGDAECFILEHVEHDRPEILKKEIDVFGLRWYGYCMFRALASLHKQGIVHRDVKPGNFLFSRKHNKGYLIDFNLANDLQHKYFKTSKLGTKSNIKGDSLSWTSTKSISLSKSRKANCHGILDPIEDPKKYHISKSVKKSSKVQVDEFAVNGNKNKCGSQVADISVVTSAKDPTSTRTSGDRLKQPIPSKGRKELINFLQVAMQGPDNKAAPVAFPASLRKRVAAPLSKADRRQLILTPMPLHSGGNAVAGAGMFKTRGNGKQKKEGPCVGTKGFRAPEVLFKSFHQGCKVDIWSAGVTLLYLMIGRAPFGGDPEQNIKEIAKLKGSEDLWEVAKLHDCESLFPADLLDVQLLQSVNLKDWCAMNTKRSEFLETAPSLLFDLVDKCLTVNPRLRITAEEALTHGFFAPCHEILRKQRQLRKAASSESRTARAPTLLTAG